MTDFLLMKKQRPIKFIRSEETADIGALPVLSQKKIFKTVITESQCINP